MDHKNYWFLIILFLPTLLFGQFEIGKHSIGPTIGFSFLGSSMQFGINHEYCVDINDLGINSEGKLGVGGLFRYWNYSENFTNVEWSYSNVLLGVQSNYHFYMANDFLDPWFGVILAYNIGSVDKRIKTIGYSVKDKSHGGFWVAANAGLSYWIKPNFAMSVRIGFGTLSYSSLDLGIDYKID